MKAQDLNYTKPQLAEGVIDRIRYIVDNKDATRVKFDDGSVLEVDLYTASAIKALYDAVNEENKRKIEDKIGQSKEMFYKLADFAFQNVSESVSRGDILVNDDTETVKMTESAYRAKPASSRMTIKEQPYILINKPQVGETAYSVKFTKNQPILEDKEYEPGTRIHAGVGTKGGAGFTGTVVKEENGFVFFKTDEGKTYKAPKEKVQPAGGINFSEGKKKPTDVPSKHQEKIAKDTVKNPNKSLMGGPTAAEAEKMLRDKFGYSDAQIEKLKESANLNEKSVSKDQQQAAGAALAAKKGETPVSELQGASKEMYDSMTKKELEDFAGTKHAGLPEKVDENKSQLSEETLQSAVSEIENMAKSPKEVVQSYDSFNDFMKKEVGPKSNGRYNWAGYTYPNKQMLKKDVEDSIKNSGAENKALAIDKGEQMVKDMKRGKIAIAFSEQPNKSGKIHIVSNNELTTFDNIHQLRKEIFKIEDKLDSPIEWFPITYQKYVVNGVTEKVEEDSLDENAFNQAAADAARAGKKEFEFDGKTYPVKMDKSTAEKLDDDIESPIDEQDMDMAMDMDQMNKAMLDPDDYGPQAGAEMAETQIHYVVYAIGEIKESMREGYHMPDWLQNKISSAHQDMQGIHSYMEGSRRKRQMCGPISEGYVGSDYGPEAATGMARTQLSFMKYAAEDVLKCISAGTPIPEWYQNKIAKVHRAIETIYSYIEGKRRSDEDENIAMTTNTEMSTPASQPPAGTGALFVGGEEDYMAENKNGSKKTRKLHENKKSDWNVDKQVKRTLASPLFQATEGDKDPEEVKERLLKGREEIEQKLFTEIALPVNDALIKLDDFLRKNGGAVNAYMSDTEKKFLKEFVKKLATLNDEYEKSSIMDPTKL